MQIFWLKRNLRLQDSVPFYRSLKGVRTDGCVLPLYIHEPNLIRQPDVSRQHQAFIQETLEELASELQALGGQLLQTVGESTDVLQRIHHQTPITRIWTHRETTQNSQYHRDRSVRTWCKKQGIELMEIEQNGIARGSQTPLTFPEYFSDSVNTELKDPTGANLSERFAPLPFPSCSETDIPLAGGEDKPLRQTGGRKAGQGILDEFFNIPNISRYPSRLSSPNSAWHGCSRISTYLTYGIISDREVFQAVDQVVSKGHESQSASEFQRLQERARFFLDRLCWRRQYIQTFENHPELETRHMLPQFDGTRETEFNQTLFTAWANGHTGIPFIDAAMRCLKETGWINMRLRATVVSFATMNLWLPTPRVARFLATEFLDYEPGIHHVIHQIVSGTSDFDGLMVYDPMKQARDHDSQGHFIRRWVPELSELEDHHLHDLSKTPGCQSTQFGAGNAAPYPAPVVDPGVTSRIARRRVHEIRNGVVESGQLGLI